VTEVQAVMSVGFSIFGIADLKITPKYFTFQNISAYNRIKF